MGYNGTANAQTGQIECEACKPGHFAPSPGMQFCLPCGRGTSQMLTGAWECEPCYPGYAQTEVGSTECFACPKGTYSLHKGEKGCTHCEPGKTSSATSRSSPCTPCSTGTAQPNSGSSLDYCPACGRGKFADHEGMSECKMCGWSRWNDGPEMGADVGCTICQPCLQMSVMFGITEPKQCIVTWVMLGMTLSIFCCCFIGRYRQGKIKLELNRPFITNLEDIHMDHPDISVNNRKQEYRDKKMGS